MSYNISLSLRLNDTDYQENFVSFSHIVYAVEPGRNTLAAWLAISNLALAAELEFTINITQEDFYALDAVTGERVGNCTLG